MTDCPQHDSEGIGPGEDFDPDASETLDSSIRPGPKEDKSPDTILPEDSVAFDPDSSATLDSGSRRAPGAPQHDSQAETLDPRSGGDDGEDFDIDSTYHPPGMPARIAGFLIKGVVGSGGMGTVYLARQDHPRRTVAVKVMNPGVTNPRALKRFEFETQMLARLQHPGIAQIYEAGTWDDGSGGVPYFAMEYVAGAKTITEFAEEKKLDMRSKLALMAEACEAVGYGHTKGIIHRDLKPGNILVTSDGHAKIIDFGVARSTDSDAAATMATGVHDIVGTLQYMAPEQCSGDVHDLDSSADVYALAVSLYELLVGDVPYEVSGLGLAGAIKVISEDKPAALGTADRRLRGEIEVIVSKAMSKERTDRYRTGSEMADDIHRYLAGEAIMACPPTLMTTLRRVIGKNRTAVAGLAVILLLLSASAIAGVYALVNRNAALEAQNETLAEQAEKTAMVSELMGYYMDDMFSSLAVITASPEVREMFVAKNMEYLEKLRAEGGNDPSLMRVVAEGLRQMGHNAWSMRGGSRGDLEAAQAMWSEALDILRPLVETNPGDVRARMLAIETHNHLFYAAMQEGNRDEARAWLEDAELLAEELPDTTHDIDQWGILIQILNDRERLDPPTGDPEQDPTIARTLELIELGETAFADSDGSVPVRVRRNGTLVWNKVAVRLSGIGEHERALAYYRKSLESRELIMGDPEEGTDRGEMNFIRRDINNSRRYVAQELINLDRHEEAVTLMVDQVLPSVRQLAREAPAEIRVQMDLAQALSESGEYLLQAGQRTDAVHTLKEAIAAWKLVAAVANAKVTDDHRATRETMRSELNLVRAGIVGGNLEEAQAAMDRVTELSGIAARKWPDDPKIARVIDVSQGVRAKLAEATRALNDRNSPSSP